MSSEEYHPSWRETHQDENSILTHFLKFLLEKEFYISKIMAERYANIVASLKEAYELKNQIIEITSPSGNLLFNRASEETISNMSEALKSLNPSISILQNYLLSIGRTFLKRQITNINSLTLDELTPNPFLMRALNLHDYKETLEFVTVSRISRSIVTSFGFFFEHLLIASGAIKEDKGFDISKVINEVVHYIQVKSGTNDINKDQIVYWKGLIEEIEKDGSKKGYIGMPYGTRNSNTVSINLLKQYFKEGFEKNTLIGTELWTFISGIKDFHTLVLEELHNAALIIMGTNTIMDNIRSKVSSMIQKFEEQYGNDQEALSFYIKSLF